MGRPLRGTVLLLAASAATTAGAASAQQPAAPRAGQPLVFDRATVVDVAGGRPLPAQRIVVEGNRIRALGAADAVPLPRGARVVDLDGKYVMPGLWNMHVHVFADERSGYSEGLDLPYTAFLTAGVTGLREMSTPHLDSILRWRREFAAGTKLGPRILTAGQAVGYSTSSVAAVTPTELFILTEEEGRRAVDSLRRAGADFLKLHSINAMPRDVYFALLAEARRIGFPVAGHPPLVASALEAVDSGQRSFEHLGGDYGTGATKSTGMTPDQESPPFFAPCWRADSAGDRQCAALAANFARHNSYFVPTLSVWAGDPFDTSQTTGPELRRRDFGLLARLQRFGVPLLAGSDAMIFGLQPEDVFSAAQGIHGELALLVEAGLTPLEALRTATLNPATYWHAADSLGTVAPGKLADLLVLDADPLADIRNTTTIRAVVANGRYYDRPALDSVRVDLERRLERAVAERASSGLEP